MSDIDCVSHIDYFPFVLTVSWRPSVTVSPQSTPLWSQVSYLLSMDSLVRADEALAELHPPVWLTLIIIITAGLTLITLLFLVWLLLRYRDSIYNW